MTLFEEYEEIAKAFWAKEDHTAHWCNSTIYELTRLKSEFFAYLEEVKDQHPSDRVLQADIKQRISQSSLLIGLVIETKEGRVRKLEAFYKLAQDELQAAKFLDLKNTAGL